MSNWRSCAMRRPKSAVELHVKCIGLSLRTAGVRARWLDIFAVVDDFVIAIL